MKILRISLLALLVFSLNTSCYEDYDDNLVINEDVDEIKDFVYNAMNTFYLYKSNIPNLADDRFATPDAYAKYLQSYETPEALFESLIYKRETVDRFSIIAEDGIALLQQLSGVIKSNGLEFLFYYQPGSDSKVFGVIKLVLNNSAASKASLKRGMIFNAVDGTPLTVDNFSALMAQETYTLNFATYNSNGTPETSDDTIDGNSESATLTKEVYNENPVHLTNVIETNGIKVGYLVYNGFTSEYDTQLNQAFGELKAANVQELVLDLRYNGGGSINSAVMLASMITGQFTGKVFSKLVYNEDLQAQNTVYNFKNKLDDGSAINSLNLQRLYILTTNNTASASELIINSLRPYINVIQIGKNTRGKTQASRPIFDSPNFGTENINPTHNYILLPLIANSINKDDALVPPTGLTPSIDLGESAARLGTLGATDEPLLAAALADISGLARKAPQALEALQALQTSIDASQVDDIMYIDVNGNE